MPGWLLGRKIQCRVGLRRRVKQDNVVVEEWSSVSSCKPAGMYPFYPHFPHLSLRPRLVSKKRSSRPFDWGGMVVTIRLIALALQNSCEMNCIPLPLVVVSVTFLGAQFRRIATVRRDVVLNIEITSEL
jgi:hypothetical protein